MTLKFGRSGLAVALAALILSGTSAMALLGTNILFSEVSGTVVRGGIPVAGAEIIQKTASSSGEVVKRTTTGSDGRFSFPTLTSGKGLADLLPGEFVVAQELHVVVNGEDKMGWLATKRDRGLNAETGGRPFELVCEVTAEETFTNVNYGICRLR